MQLSICHRNRDIVDACICLRFVGLVKVDVPYKVYDQTRLRLSIKH